MKMMNFAGAILAVGSVYIVSVVCVVTKLALIEIYGWAVKSGGCTLLGMCAFTSGFLGLLVLGITTALTRLTCAEFGANVILPFLMKQPLALLGAPFVYMFKTSCGAGPGVKGMIELWKDIETLSGAECIERLVTHGRGADLNVADVNGVPVKWLDDVLEEVEGGDWGVQGTVEELQRVLKETVYVIETSLLHELNGLTSKVKKTGEWKATREKLIKKLNGRDVLGVMKAHPMRNWRVQVRKNDEFCMKNETFCIQNDELCKDEELLIKTLSEEPGKKGDAVKTEAPTPGNIYT